MGLFSILNVLNKSVFVTVDGGVINSVFYGVVGYFWRLGGCSSIPIYVQYKNTLLVILQTIESGCWTVFILLVCTAGVLDIF